MGSIRYVGNRKGVGYFLIISLFFAFLLLAGREFCAAGPEQQQVNPPGNQINAPHQQINTTQQHNGAAVPQDEKATMQAVKPELFKTSSGMTGWKVHIPDSRPLATPAVNKGTLFLGGGYGSYHFYALDATTGKAKWVFRTKDDGPTAAVVAGRSVYFNTECCTIYNLDTETGKEKWSKWLGDPLMSQPAADEQGHVFMAYPGKSGSHELACMNDSDGKLVWSAPIDTDIITAPVVVKDSVYLSTMKGTVCRFQAGDGRCLYKKAQQATSAPWIEEGKILVSLREETRDTGKTVSPEAPVQNEGIGKLAGTSGERAQKDLWGYQKAAYLDSRSNAREQEANKKLDSTVGFGTAPATAKMEHARKNIGQMTVAGCWSYQGSRPSVYKGQCITAMGDRLKRIDAASGKLCWEKNFADEKNPGTRTLTPPSLTPDKAVVATTLGDVICLSQKDGKVLWQFSVKEPVVFQPALWKGRVFVATTLGNIYCVDTGDKALDGWYMWGGNASHNGLSK
jgi:Ca-activated chloride channel homolog